MLRAVATTFCVLFAALLLAPRSAHAFERTRVDTNNERAVFWRFRTILLYPAPDTSNDLPATAVNGAVLRSIEAWNNAAGPCSDLLLADNGYPSALGTNLTGARPDGENRIVFREEGWPEMVSSATLALTTTVYRRSTGEIEDADIDLNGQHHVFTNTDDPALTQTDLENTLTHELGHLIGLAHTEDPDATMYSVSLPGDLVKRTLSDDELEAVCWVYPDGRLSPSAPRIPGAPLTSSCAVRPTLAGSSHSRSRTSASMTRGYVGLGLALTALMWIRRRRAASR